MQDLDERAQDLVKKGETLQGSDWRLKEMAPNRATAVREVFREGDLKAVALVQAVLVLGRPKYASATDDKLSSVVQVVA